MTPNAPDLDRELDQFQKLLPRPAGRAIEKLMRPSSRYVRLPVAALLIAGGVVGFLPVLGFWMLPLGLVLVARDVPLVRPPMARMLGWINRKWPAKKSESGDAGVR
jgi:hypothetical protein